MPDQEPTFEATIRPERLRDAIAPASIYDPGVARMTITADGLQIRATDLSRVSSVDSQLSDAAFDSYRLTPDSIEVGIRPRCILESIALIEPRSHVEICVDDTDLTIRTSELKTMFGLEDPSAVVGVLSTQEYDYPSKVVLRGDELNSAVKLADLIASQLTIGVAPSGANLYGVATGNADSVRFSCEPEKMVRSQMADIESAYPTDYLSRIQREIPDGVTIEMSLGENAPLEIRYSSANGQGTVQFRVQPTVREE